MNKYSISGFVSAIAILFLAILLFRKKGSGKSPELSAKIYTVINSQRRIHDPDGGDNFRILRSLPLWHTWKQGKLEKVPFDSIVVSRKPVDLLGINEELLQSLILEKMGVVKRYYLPLQEKREGISMPVPNQAEFRKTDGTYFFSRKNFNIRNSLTVLSEYLYEKNSGTKITKPQI